MAVLLTGGAGYIGTHTCVELMQSGQRAVVVDNYSNSSPEALRRAQELAGQPVTVYEADLLDGPALGRVFDQEDIDTVIHFAGLKAVGESVHKPLAYYNNNVAGAIQLLEQMKKHRVRKIIFSSSATVYGVPKSMPLTEDMPSWCTSPYGWTKFMIERMLMDVATADPELSVVLLRYFNPIGAHESGRIGEDPNGIPNNLIPYIAQVAIGKLQRLPVYGNDYDTPDGTGVRDYLHVVDLAKGHVAALHYADTHTGVEVINLGTGKGYSVLELLHTFERVNNLTIPFEIVGRRPGDVAEVWADVSKAKRLLGWRAEKTLEDMCRDTWRWQSQNPNGYGV